jgi:hypothetical protein
MIRISKGSGIKNIKIGTDEIDSMLLIPGITFYNGIYIIGLSMILSKDSPDETVTITFSSQPDLERQISIISKELTDKTVIKNNINV